MRAPLPLWLGSGRRRLPPGPPPLTLPQQHPCLGCRYREPSTLPKELPLVPEELLKRLSPRPKLPPSPVAPAGAASPRRLAALLGWGADRVRRAQVGTRHDTL
jgi:hypothetical protein